jgi:hypothetical protein
LRKQTVLQRGNAVRCIAVPCPCSIRSLAQPSTVRPRRRGASSSCCGRCCCRTLRSRICLAIQACRPGPTRGYRSSASAVALGGRLRAAPVPGVLLLRAPTAAAARRCCCHCCHSSRRPARQPPEACRDPPRPRSGVVERRHCTAALRTAAAPEAASIHAARCAALTATLRALDQRMQAPGSQPERSLPMPRLRGLRPRERRVQDPQRPRQRATRRSVLPLLLLLLCPLRPASHREPAPRPVLSCRSCCCAPRLR